MRLLLIEDETAIGRHIKESCQDRGFVCDWVQTGDAGVEYASVEDYDCIVLDRRLPDIDGIEVCRQIRERSLPTPIIFLTALGHVEQKIEGLEAGADDYLAKPFEMDELIARINALLRRASYQNNPELHIGDITLHSALRTVMVKGKVLALSNREYLLLEYLMRNAGKPVTRTQILDHIWETDLSAESNLVDVYINYIRKKIDSETNSSSYIETIRGYGYRFIQHT